MPARPSRRRVLQVASVGVGSAVSGCIADLAGDSEPEKPERSANAPPLKWISDVNADSARWTTPRIHDGTIYSGGDYHVWALDAADGSKRWRYEIIPPGDTYYHGRLDVSDGIVYTAEEENAYAIDEDGKSQWVVDTGANLSSAPAISKEFLFFWGGDQATLDRASGALKVERDLHGTSRATPAFSDERVFVGLSNGKLAAFSRTPNQIRLMLDTETERVAAPLFVDGVVFVGTSIVTDPPEGTGYLYAADVEAERWLWRVETGQVRNNLPPAIHDDTIFVTTDSGTLYAIATTNGQIRWTFETGAEDPSVPRLGDGLVYVANGNRVMAVDIDTGEERWNVKWENLSVALVDSPPLVTEDALYVGTDARMYAFDLS